MKKPTPVSHLLEQGDGMLKKLRLGTAEAQRTLAALRAQLPPEIAQEIFSASLRGTTLTAFVASAGWGTRLRYVAPQLLPALADALGAPVEEVKVKVRAEPKRLR
jgi:predicted nucleic acid-binding Zn ribbon protein